MISRKNYLSILTLLLIFTIFSSCKDEKIQYRDLGTDAIERLNQNIEANKVTEVAEIANLFSPKDLVSEGNYTYKVVINENGPLSEIEIKEEGVMDDSIDGILTKILVKKDGNQWVVTEIKQAYKCKKNRGHQEWGPEFCN